MRMDLDPSFADRDEAARELLMTVEMYAYAYWERAGCTSDFCTQLPFDGEVVVFGSVNRVQWTIRGGFHVFKECCSPNFLEANMYVAGD